MNARFQVGDKVIERRFQSAVLTVTQVFDDGKYIRVEWPDNRGSSAGPASLYIAVPEDFVPVPARELSAWEVEQCRYDGALPDAAYKLIGADHGRAQKE